MTDTIIQKKRLHCIPILNANTTLGNKIQEYEESLFSHQPGTNNVFFTLEGNIGRQLRDYMCLQFYDGKALGQELLTFFGLDDTRRHRQIIHAVLVDYFDSIKNLIEEDIEDVVIAFEARHMPCFVYLSGLVYSRNIVEDIQPYLRHLNRLYMQHRNRVMTDDDDDFKDSYTTPIIGFFNFDPPHINKCFKAIVHHRNDLNVIDQYMLQPYGVRDCVGNFIQHTNHDDFIYRVEHVNEDLTWSLQNTFYEKLVTM